MRFTPSRLRPATTLFALVTAAPACFLPDAQAAPPREINSIATEMSPRISKCLIQREPALIDRWLRTLPGSAAEGRLVATAEPRFPACFPPNYGALGSAWLPKYDTAGMRSALVRALLLARRRNLPADPPAGLSPLYSGLSGSSDAPGDAAAIVAADLGACLARKHWAGVLAIVRAADPDADNFYYSQSKKYVAARKREAATVDSELAKMIPYIPDCVPAGAKLRINRLGLRRILEEAAYRMTGPGPAAPAAR